MLLLTISASRLWVFFDVSAWLWMLYSSDFKTLVVFIMINPLYVLLLDTGFL